ncbi:MAG: cation transporter [Rhodobacterales bacterium]|nr:cation transporter [Rhodobacterales bacterium]
MSGCSCSHEMTRDEAADRTYRRVLWTVIAINFSMFLVETTAGRWGQSVSLQADALDFLGDSATYLVSLLALSMGAAWRARTALLKGATMGLFGLYVLGTALWHVLVLNQPVAPLMGGIGALAFVANVASALLLFRHRAGDANMQSVWLCTRNDAIANVAVMLAALGVWTSGTAWPDLIVAAGIAGLAFTSSVRVVRLALGELSAARAAA